MLAPPPHQESSNDGGFDQSDDDDGVRKAVTTSSAADEVVKRQIIILAGPTAVGKSDVAMNLLRRPTTTTTKTTMADPTKAAARWESSSRGVLISADSVQVYRGVEIGANKAAVGSDERRRTVLIDLVDNSNYTTGDWYDDALFTIQRLMDWNEKDEPPTAPAADTAPTADDVAVQQRRAIILESIRAALDDDSDNGILPPMDNDTEDDNGTSSTTTTSPPRPTTTIVPIIVGGTMMYLQWLIQGRPDAMRPSATALIRAQRDIEARQQHDNDWDGAKQFVASQGPAYEGPVDHLFPNDWYRLRRILEIAYTEEEQKRDDAAQKVDGPARDNERNDDDDHAKQQHQQNVFSGRRRGRLVDELPNVDVRCFFLCPDDRMAHAKVIDRRCENMIERGLIDETADLSSSSFGLPDMAAKAIGYRQTLEYLTRIKEQKQQQQQQRRETNVSEDNNTDVTAMVDATAADHEDDDDAAFQEYLEEFCAATRQYAKRQMQWFRREKDFYFVPVPVVSTVGNNNNNNGSGNDDDPQHKEQRIQAVADQVRQLLGLSRDAYDAVLASPTSTSTTTRRLNEEQGKKMRVYCYQTTSPNLRRGTLARRDIARQACAAAERVPTKKRHKRPSAKEEDAKPGTTT